MDAASISLLARLIEMGSASLLQYVCESVPFTPPKLQPTYDKVAVMAQEERAEVARFIRFLQRKHVRIKPPESYPSHFTTMNYCSFDFLLPKLVVEHEKEVAEIDNRLPMATDLDVQKMAAAYLHMKRQHLAWLRELTA